MAAANDPVFFVAGPTASGKSAYAAAMAARIGGEVICGDAFQLYAGLPILTAQPTANELARAPHHLYGSVPVSDEMDAARYASMAERVIAEVHSRGRLPIVTGGSGLYLKALTHGLSPLPPGDSQLRAELDLLSTDDLATRLLELDPDSPSYLNMKNPRHVSRALEICLLTGKPASTLKQSFAAAPRLRATGVVLQWDRPTLYDRINRRTVAMMASGAIDEVQALSHTHLSITAEKTIGLRELRAVAGGDLAMADAVADIQQSTRRYAKRQTMWFRRESWLQVLDCDAYQLNLEEK